MKKKVFCFLTALLMVISATILPAYADESTVQEDFYQQLADLVSKQDYSKFFDEMELQIGSNILAVDGETQILTAAPEITNNSTMLPIRAVAEAAGAEVDWEPTTSTVLIESAGGDTISCSIGSPTITVNDQTSSMSVTPYIKQDKTYMPLRAVAEALELEVDWEGTTQTIRLTAPYQTARLIVLADQLSTQGLDAVTVLSDGTGMWVLQFETPTQAREAAEVLGAQGILVEPDRYIPPIEDEAVPEVAASGTHYSWGAEDCWFDSFVSRYISQFTGEGVVAVVDTGVDSSHPFLQGRVLSNGYDFIDEDSTPNDGHSHGTHVAGTIIDCAGSAPVSILPVRVLNNQGQGSIVIVAAGIKYAADHGADVINLSLGGGHSNAQDSAISYAIEKGCLVVAAAGNESENTANSCPAHITMGGMVVVSAGDSNHNKAYFSNYGSSVDLMAPGVSITATVPGGSFGIKSGTSMAAPHVAAAAMLIDLAWGKTLTPAELEKELYSATTYGKWTNSTVGAGFLDLSRANAPTGNITTPGINLSHNSLSLKVGESQTLTASVTPSGTAVSWSSSNAGVATVSGGKVTAVSQGTATITAQITYNGISYQAKCTVTVAAAGGVLVPSVVGKEQSEATKLLANQGLQFEVWWVEGEADTDLCYVLEQSIPAGSTVDAGTVVRLRLTSARISLSYSSLSLKVGESQTLTANVTPGGTAVTWSSSNTGVATVSSGKVTAVGQGTATITAQMYYGGRSYTATCQVTVANSKKETTYTFNMQMTIIADDAIVSALQNAGFNMSAIVDTSGYTWRYSDGFFVCDTSTSVSYDTLKTIDSMEFWDFQYSDLAAQLYPYNYGTAINTAVTSGHPSQYSLGKIGIRGFSYPRI